MSASAIKSTMPGVGSNSSTPAHAMLPMNMMAQKVVQSTEASAMKPLPGSNLNYVTLQSPNQPLSLVQDHRPQVYQAPLAYSTPSIEKEVESNPEKTTVLNGLEAPKAETESAPAVVAKQALDASKINSSDGAAHDQQPLVPHQPQLQNLTTQQPQPPQQSQPQPAVEELQVAPSQPPAQSPVQSRVEEKKSLTNSSGKDSEEREAPSKVAEAHKADDSAPKAESPQKSKSQINASAAKSESSATQATPPKSSKTAKRKPKETSESKRQDSFEPKRKRRRAEPFQSPLPEIAMIVKTLSKPSVSKPIDEKLVVFYKNEFLAVRNTEGSFFVCQAMQNIYKSTRRIRIRWLSQDKTNGEIYSPDFYDFTDFDCILTNLDLIKIDKNKYQLTKMELLRTENILKRAIDVEAGVCETPSVTEDHPDGLDLSLYKDEAQLKTKKESSGKQKRLHKKAKAEKEVNESSSESEEEDSGDEKVLKKKSTAKKSVTKKRSPGSKVVAPVAKTVTKTFSRAERALNRNKDTGTTNNVAPATKTESKKVADSKKVAVKATPPSSNSSATSRGKLRGGSVQATPEKQENKSNRLKRGTAAVVVDEPNSRKKTRGKI